MTSSRAPETAYAPPDWAGFAFDALPELVVVVDSHGLVVHANRRAAELLRTRVEDWVGRSAIEVLHPDDMIVGAELLVSAQTGREGPKEPVRYRLVASDGALVPVIVIASKAVIGDRTYLVMSGRPEREARPSQAIADEVTSRLAQMFDEAAIGLAQAAFDGRLLRVNHTLARDLGSDESELAQVRVHDLIGTDQRSEFSERWDDLVTRKAGPLSLVASVPVSDRSIHLHLTGSVVSDRHGDPMYVALQALNVTQRVEAEIALRHSEQQLLLARSQLEFLSTHDTLTGLGNRLLLDQVFRDTAHDPAASVAVMCLDLDGFKRVNDKHGHGAGDGLLVEVARRIAAAVGPTDTAIRFGGDEFVVVMPNQTFEVAERVCEAVVQAVAQPYSINGVDLRVGSSAGMVLTPAVPSWQAAVEQADRLLYQAKSDPAARLRTRNDLAP